MFRWWQERGRQVSSQRHWVPALVWRSPNCAVSLGEIAAVGPDGEHYDWNLVVVTECRDGLVLAVREFDDEDSAFGYAESVVTEKSSRLSLMNAPSRMAYRVLAALRAGDLDTIVEAYADNYVHADHRRLSGGPVTDRDSMRDAWGRIVRLYNRFEIDIIATRGERLHLLRHRWSDDSGNQSIALILNETDDSERIVFQDRFDEDDFAAAYAELDRRYYAGEGAPYADEGLPLVANLHAENRGDLDGAFQIFSAPGLRIESRSHSVFPTRTADELRRSVEELSAMVTSYRVWSPAACWLSKNWIVARHEREALGRNGEKLSWSRLWAGETHGGRFTSLCEFDADDEEAAFAYAEERMRAAASRLAVCNRASEAGEAMMAAMRAHDANRVVEPYANEFVYDDRRPFSGDPISGIDEMRVAAEQVFQQYKRFDNGMLAVRGDRLALGWSKWSDEAGNEAAHLHLVGVNQDGLIDYHARFDADDFKAAYTELERRYYTGEGTPYAAEGRALTEIVLAENRGDLDGAFSVYLRPGLEIESRSRSIFPTRTAAELRRSVEELGAMVSSYRVWSPACCWLSPNWVVARHEREAVGSNGETLTWSRLYAGEIRGGMFASLCEFDVDDEDAAFAYAEERMRATSGRLAVSNRASEVGCRFVAALYAGDIDGATAFYSDRVVYDDRRRLSGDPISGSTAVRAAIERFGKHYNRFELDTLAVRGERLQLARHRWSDDSGNQSAGIILAEIDDDGHVIYDGRFDEDDFDGAYSELESRYYSGEGAEFAQNSLITIEFLEAMDTLDVERARRLCLPTFRLFSPPSTFVAQERSLDEFFRWQRERTGQVSSVKNFLPVIRWLSPNCFVTVGGVVGRGSAGEEYTNTWARIHVGEFSAGFLSYMRQFVDEDAAFIYAKERVDASRGRLAVINRASGTAEAFVRAMQAHDIEAALTLVDDDIHHVDHRRISGDPLQGKVDSRLALQRILHQYNRFEMRTLAVRGDLLVLYRTRWFDDSGNETAFLHVAEVGEDGRIVTDARFDEDDFNGAFEELERRYYSGEGAAFAESGNTAAQVVTVGNNHDYDKFFNELAVPGLRVDSRAGTIFPERTPEELRDSVELFHAMVASSRIWYSAVRWLSPECAVVRQEREAVGEDGECYEWSRIYVAEFENGLYTAVCDFDVEFEEQAFAYAEERMLATSSPLPASNPASEAAQRVTAALRAGDVGSLLACASDDYVIDDRRRIAAYLLRGHEALRAGTERVLAQYTAFKMTTLAVRGGHLALSASTWSDDSGNESTQLHVFELGDDGLLRGETRFDEDDFEAAYRELESRYYAGEGAAFAKHGLFAADYVATMNRGDFDTMFNELSSADFRFQNRGRSPFPDRSARELRASFEDLYARLASVRSWFSSLHWVSPTTSVGRLEREGVGHDGTQFAWTRILVNMYRDGRLASIWEFDEDDEAAALAFAEESLRSAQGRLTVRNRATAAAERVTSALRAGDVEALVSCVSEDYFLDDRRQFSGDQLRGHESLRAGTERVLQHFNTFESRPLAVRGERFALCLLRWSDASGNESTHLHVIEVGNDDRIAYEVRHDEDDFEDAYRELEERYYAGEGAESAQPGMVIAKYTETLSRGDLDTLFDEVCTPDVRVESRSRSVFLDRSATELRSSLEELQRLVGTTRNWFAAIRWISPQWAVGLYQREAVGDAGEQYEWTRIVVCEVWGRRLTYACQFEMEDEAAAFAHAEEQARASTSPLVVANRASALFTNATRSLNEGDPGGLLSHYADDYVFDDRRRLSGDPIVGKAALRPNVERILQQFNSFESRLLAVRGERLALGWSRWSDAAGNQTSYLHVWELNDDGLVARDIRFDEDDFEGAYRELESRYYGELGDEFQAQGKLAAEYVLTANRGDFDTLFGELSSKDLRVKNRSRSLFPDRTAEELRASYEELYAMVPTVRSWFSVGRWMSPTVYIGRLEREGVGRDGERYSWSRILVNEYQDGRAASMCEFDADDDVAALAYARERAAQT